MIDEPWAIKVPVLQVVQEVEVISINWISAVLFLPWGEPDVPIIHGVELVPPTDLINGVNWSLFKLNVIIGLGIDDFGVIDNLISGHYELLKLSII